MNSTIKSIILKIADRLGLVLQERKEAGVNYTDKGLNPTAIAANVVASIAIDDSEITIIGDSARAEAMRNFADYFTDSAEDIAAEVALGMGDALIRPYTDGEEIGLSVIGADDFLITASIGNTLKGVVMKLDEYKTEKASYRFFEYQGLNTAEQKVTIRRFAYKDGNECPLAETVWDGWEEELEITASQLLLARYKCPTINRDNYNSPNGVPITYGCEDIISQVQKKYDAYNDEIDRSKKLIFADRKLFKKNDDGETFTLSPADNFVMVRGGLDGGIKTQIDDYSPSIREAEYKSANDFNLAILELCCGFSKGVLTKPETAFATATEMKNSLKKTFAYVKKFRRKIEDGNRDLFNAVNIIMNLNGTTPEGEWDIQHDWSYDYIEQTQERFNQLIQSVNAGAVKTEELTSWVLGLDADAAKEYVEELRAETQARAEENLRIAVNE